MFLHLTILAAVVALVNGDCTVDINTQLNDHKPLFLRNNKLVVPNGPSMHFKAWEWTTIACPGSTVTKTGTVTATIQCVSGQTFNLNAIIINLARVNIAKIACSSHPKTSLQNTGESCGNGGTRLILGYEIPGIGFVKYFQSCYNMETDSVIYSY